MSTIVDTHDETGLLEKKHLEFAQAMIHHAIEFEQVAGNVEVSVLFVDESRIQEINLEYREINAPTDVISFALNESNDDEIDIMMEGMPNMLGDIIVSVSHIEKQAKEYGHTFLRELGFLLVHGLLHLLGYDHDTKEKEKEMFQKQEDILSAYGLTR